jgi:hypothetical protein
MRPHFLRPVPVLAAGLVIATVILAGLLLGAGLAWILA